MRKDDMLAYYGNDELWVLGLCIYKHLPDLSHQRAHWHNA